MSILHKRLSPDEQATFEAWARANWTPDTAISEIWHPAVRAEWHRLDAEHARKANPESVDAAWSENAAVAAAHERTLTPDEAAQIWNPVARALVDPNVTDEQAFDIARRHGLI